MPHFSGAGVCIRGRSIRAAPVFNRRIRFRYQIGLQTAVSAIWIGPLSGRACDGTAVSADLLHRP